MKNNTPLTPPAYHSMVGKSAGGLQMGTNLNKMNTIGLILLLQVDIEEKMKNAPDSGYEIGVVIGTYLPFVFLVGLAYFFYYKAKKRKDLDD